MTAIVFTSLVISGCTLLNSDAAQNSETGTKQYSDSEMTEAKAELMVHPLANQEAVTTQFTAQPPTLMKLIERIETNQPNLADVSGGQGSGTAVATTAEGTYQLFVQTSALPKPSGTDFYEGWVVRQEPLSVISTGRLEIDESQPSDEQTAAYLNIYANDMDLSDHLKYVLTLEPDDGDPAPATHILDGEVTIIE